MNVTLHLTTGCNLRCSYCFEGEHASRDDMSSDVSRAAIDFALRHGGESPGIVFFGGEPLLKRDLIIESVAYARAQTKATGAIPHFKITTNGMLLDDEFLTFCAQEDVAISLSFDGVEPAQNRHRLNIAGQGTFARVSERARALLQYRPYSPAILVTTPETVSWAAESVRYLFGLGFRYIIFQVNYAGAWTDALLEELKAQYWQMAEFYVEMTRQEEKFYLSPFDIKIATHIRGADARGLLCRLGVRQVSVAPDGTLFPCVQFVPHGDGKRDRSFAIGDVWRGVDEAKRSVCFHEAEQEEPECADCSIKDRCNHHCGCLNLQTMGELGAPAPVLCEHERIVTPIADWIGETLWKERAPMFVQKHYNKGFAILSLVEDRSRVKAG
jgi:uncharacterized protein